VLVVDVVVALLLAVTVLVGLPSPIAVPVLLAATLPIAVRRRWPLAVFWVVLAAAAVAIATGVLTGAHLLVALPLYTVAVRCSPRAGVVSLVAALVVTAMGVVRLPGLVGTGTAGGLVVPGGAAIVAAWALGVALRSHRKSVALQAVTEERLRLARELHDVIAHGLGAITVHAGVARHVLATRPEELPKIIGAIEESAREGTRDLRRLLDALHAREQASPPMLTALDGVVARVSAAGVRTTVDVRGTVRPLPAATEEGAFRIVQEALTNVVKHAAPARAEVVLEYRPEELLVEVTDDGAGGPVVPGHGITGMRERAEACGGVLAVGPQERGFRVAAVLPTGETR
jgi:signal transduction histidine kinase